MNRRFGNFVSTTKDNDTSRLVVSINCIRVGLLAILFFTANGAFNRVSSATGLVWTVASAVTLLWILRQPHLMERLLARNWTILLLPLFAILSTAWSVSPATSLLNSMQMLFTTIISLRIIEVLTTRQILLALGAALGVASCFSVVNLLTSFSLPVFETNGAFLGIFSQKNNFAKAVFWLAFAAMALALIDRKPSIGLATVVLTFPLTVISMSRTGQVGYFFIFILLFFAIVRRFSANARFLVPSLCFLAVVCIAIAYSVTGGALIGDILVLMGKSPTLTGRTIIWDLGLAVWRENILVGIGFNAFWTSSVFADQVAFISSNVDDGLHGFHNVYIEFLVAFGVVGAGLLVWLLSNAWLRLLRVFLVTRNLEAAIWLAILTALIIFGGFEDSFSKPRSGHFMLAIMAVSFSRQKSALLR